MGMLWLVNGLLKLAVNQFKNNKFNKNFYYADKELKKYGFKKNFWMGRMKEKVNFVQRNLADETKRQEVIDGIELLKYEVEGVQKLVPDYPFEKIDQLTIEQIDGPTIELLKEYLAELNDLFIDKYNELTAEKDKIVVSLNKTDEDREAFIKLKDDYTNESLTDLVTNKNDLNKIIEWNNRLIQHSNPVYKDPDGFRAHFFAPSKELFGTKITTFSANLLVIWLFSIVLAVTLYFDLLKHFLDWIEKQFTKIKFAK